MHPASLFATVFASTADALDTSLGARWAQGPSLGHPDSSLGAAWAQGTSLGAPWAYLLLCLAQIDMLQVCDMQLCFDSIACTWSGAFCNLSCIYSTEAQQRSSCASAFKVNHWHRQHDDMPASADTETAPEPVQSNFLFLKSGTQLFLENETLV